MLVTVVGQRSQCFTETLSAGYVALIRGRCGVGIVDKTAAQSVIAAAVVEIGSHRILNFDPTTAVETEQSVGEIIQTQEVVPGHCPSGEINSHAAWQSIGRYAITGEVSHSVSVSSGSHTHATLCTIHSG